MVPARLSLRRPIDVVVAGLAVVDVIGRPVRLSRLLRRGSLQYIDSLTLTTGGNVSNYGIDLAKLGFRVGAITRVGDDGLGKFIRSRYAEFGIHSGGVIIDPDAQSSATIVCVDETGERTFLHTRGCLRHFRARDVFAHMGMIKKARVLAFGYLGLLPECEPEMPYLFATVKRQTGVGILLDTGGTPKSNPRLLKALLPHVDYFVPSLDEAAALTGESSPRAIIRSCRDAGARGVVGVKMGARGCMLSFNDREEHIPPVRVKRVVDATGAGDAFVAGFLAGILKGFDPFAAARVANAVAASCVTAVGASTAILPLEAYLKKL
jgi:sugar/nucleoside kinase (ribokinase family)